MVSDINKDKRVIQFFVTRAAFKKILMVVTEFQFSFVTMNRNNKVLGMFARTSLYYKCLLGNS